jgi:hypothetical protein
LLEQLVRNGFEGEEEGGVDEGTDEDEGNERE